MKPVTELSIADGIEGLAFDIDDTVTRDGYLETVALDALWRLRQAQIRLVALTGRPLGWVDVIVQHWPVDLAIGENGAGWTWRDARRSYEGYFDDEATRRTQTQRLETIDRLVRQQFPELRHATDQRARRCDIAFDIGEQEHLSREEIAAVAHAIEAQGARAPCSSVHAHIVVGGWNKALGFVRAHEARFGRPPALDRWVFVGDSGNDAAAFELFPHSVGVRNVEDHLADLPHPPAFVTTADRGRGFAELADHLIALQARSDRSDS